MTWYFDPYGDSDGNEVFDAYDHEGTKVVTAEPIPDEQSWGRDENGNLIDVPQAMLDVMSGKIGQSGASSAYNQNLIADVSGKNINHGTPP